MADRSAIPSFFDPKGSIGFVMKLALATFLLALSYTTATAAQSGNAVPSGGTTQSVEEHQQRARQYLQEKKPKLAIPEFAAIVATDPNNLDAQANLGVLLYFDGRLAEAEPHLRTALELKPDLANIQALLGMCDHQMGREKEARQELEAALPELSETKVHVQAGLVLAESYSASGELTKAAAIIEGLRQVAPTDPRVLFAAYRIYSDLAREGMLDLALAAPKSGQMYQAIAHELYRIRDFAGAIASYKKAIAADPNLPGVHFDLAEALHASDSQFDKAAAEGEYALALKQNPGETEAAVRLGDIHADRNDLAGAAAFYEQALKVQPGMPEASIGLAQVESERGENDKALVLLEGVIAADPSNMLAHFRLSALYRKMHRPEDAKRELAEYQKIRDLKDSLRQVYSTMKLQAPGSADAGAADEDKGDGRGGAKSEGVSGKSGVKH
jgi:tetratricopeptide (TPR) repeat protein